MWAKQLSSITLRRPENLCPVEGKWGPRPMEEAQASNPSAATY